MTALLVVLMFAGFLAIDILVRLSARRLKERRDQREREAILETAVRLDVSHEARTLHRAEVPNPKARILAVDDDPVVLDSFRRILVLEGYSVDTVENGPEALGLVQRHDYDLVFTDLKMPEMTGVEVVKAVKHLRPDVDVAVITGYATLESAVETMQYGAVDYVQKPFTPEELAEFAKRLTVKRQARLEAQRRPEVHLVAPALADAVGPREYCVPGGAFLSNGHTWARIESDGQVRVGIDDFARKALGTLGTVDLPRPGAPVRRGEPLFTMRRGERAAHFTAPVSGTVKAVNHEVLADPSLVSRSPYGRGWICALVPSRLADEIGALHIGQPVVAWYQEEIGRLRDVGGPAEGGTPAVDWPTFEQNFLKTGS